MKQIKIRNQLAGLLLTSLGACAMFAQPQINVGEEEQLVILKLGKPTHRYQDGVNHLLEYAKGPWGQQTYMARIGADGKLISYEQVLTAQKFASLKIGIATKEDVLRTIGVPSETTFLALSNLEVWTYPYRESGAWDSLMHVHFDPSGTVRQMLNGPDPSRDPSWHLPHGSMRTK